MGWGWEVVVSSGGITSSKPPVVGSVSQPLVGFQILGMSSGICLRHLVSLSQRG